MADLRIGTLSFTTSPQRDALAALRQRYVKIGNKYQDNFVSIYPSFRTADDLFQFIPKEVERAIAETVEMAASDISANRVYDTDLASISADLNLRVAANQDSFDRVQEKYFEILGKSTELEAQRMAARESRGRLVGGGFGVEGAAQGIAMATVANAAMGLTYGLGNLAGKAASALGDARKKRSLLEDPNTKTDIADFLCRIILQGYELVASVVNKATGTVVYDVVSEDDQRRSAALVANVSAGRVPDKDIRLALVQALECNPFNEKAWREWIDRFDDESGSIAESAGTLGVTYVVAHKRQLLMAEKSKLSWSTSEDCRANCAILEKHAVRLGLPFDEERLRIEQQAEALDLANRTFGGTVYATPAEANSARSIYEDTLKRTVAGVVYETIAEADTARLQAKAQIISAWQADDAMGWLTLGYRRSKDFSGRSSRKEFWMFMLAFTLVLVFLTCATAISPYSNRWMFGLSVIIFVTGSLVSYLSLQVRRFHDINMSGWFTLLNFIPYVGWAIAVGFMLVDGTPDENRFGSNPKQI